MNIRCPNCQTVFRVDPARVPAGGIRARCSRCSETFFVQRDQDTLAGGARATPAPAAAPMPRALDAAPPSTARAPAAGSTAAAERFTPAAQAGPAAADSAPAVVQPAPQAAAPVAAATAERSGWGAPAASPGTAATAGRPGWSTPPAAPAAPAAAAAERTAYAAPPAASAAPAAPAAAPSFAPRAPAPAVAAAPPAAPAAAPRAAESPPRPHTFGSRDPDARAMRIARALVSDIIAYHPKRWESSRDAGTLRAEFREEIMKSWEEYVAQVGLELAKSTPHFRTALNDILARGQQIF